MTRKISVMEFLTNEDYEEMKCYSSCGVIFDDSTYHTISISFEGLVNMNYQYEGNYVDFLVYNIITLHIDNKKQGRFLRYLAILGTFSMILVHYIRS